MIAAIYARKSTGQNVAPDAKSVTRQVDNAKRFITQQGWTLGPDLVFVDDAVSGADTKRLVQRAAMIEAARRGSFDAVVMQAQDRFSRGEDGHHEMKLLARHVQVWFYSDGSQFATGNLAANVTGFLRAEIAAEFRRVIASKTHEAHRRRAEAGKFTGGKVFGYQNVRDPKTGYMDRVIHEPEARVVRDIFKRYPGGKGFKQIAHDLNARKLPSPRPQRGRPAGGTRGPCAPSCDVHCIAAWSSSTARRSETRQVHADASARTHPSG